MPIAVFFKNIKKMDWLLLAAVLLLSLIGLASLYTTSLNVENPDWELFNKQLMFFILGFVLLITVALIDYRMWINYSMIVYAATVGLMVLVLLIGTNIRGTTGWFYIFGFGLQPVELMKIALILAIAFIYHKKRGREKELTTILAVFGLTLLPVILALSQPDFGSAFIMFAIGVGYYLLYSLKAKHLIVILVLIVVVSFMAWNYLLLDYQKNRINSFINPMSDPLGEGYNIRQSIIAVGSGQLTGRGLGLGTQSQLQFLPEIQTDFIFATIAEGLGFLGVCLIMVLFAIILFRIIIIMKRCSNILNFSIVFGIGLLIFIQMLINISMNLGILPVVGLSLPFISYGGSFLIASLVSVGIVESVKITQNMFQ